MKNKKGFTLIELLAVIVILGLLMAIAIPSVTKYITQSRKKTVTSTISNYIGALVNDVNDLTYTFTGNNTIYAVPIECIALERGGTNPFGHWLHANNAYWAYVLVQYDDVNSSYTYGYTFKDSAGYGIYPTSQAKLNEQGKQIKTGLELSRPQTGKVTTITSVSNWNGFKVDGNTDLVVLKAESEGNIGDGETTCTLQQKGDNYASVENENNVGDNNHANETYFFQLIKKNNIIIGSSLPLANSNNNISFENGLYSSNDTNSGKATYYFRGNVTNNNVEFAGLKWKIIRINEDGTVRLILDGAIGWNNYQFNSAYDNYKYMYYSNSDTAKPTLDNWYKTNITNKGYDSYVSTGVFCEEAKVKVDDYTSGNANMVKDVEYTPSFKCSNDGNGKGIVNSKVGLISYDEVKYASGYSDNSGSRYYLYSENYQTWTMSPAGFCSPDAYTWYVDEFGYAVDVNVDGTSGFRPVINLKADLEVTGTGTSSDPYVIQTK